MIYKLQRVLGFRGRFKSGKTTHANAFCKIDKRYRIYSLADEMKSDIANRHGITVAALEADKANYRKEMQTYGQRKKDETGDQLYWVHRMVDKVAHDESTHIIVPDVRFHYEALGLESIVGWGRFYLIELKLTTETAIKRYERDHNGRVPTKEELNHASEVEWEEQIKKYMIDMSLLGQSLKQVYVPDLAVSAELPLKQVAAEIMAGLAAVNYDFKVGGMSVRDRLAVYKLANQRPMVVRNKPFVTG